MNNLHPIQPIRTLPLQALHQHQSPDGSYQHPHQSFAPGLQNLDATNLQQDPNEGLFQRYLASNAAQAQQTIPQHALHPQNPGQNVFGHDVGLQGQHQFHGLPTGPYSNPQTQQFNLVAANAQQFQHQAPPQQHRQHQPQPRSQPQPQQPIAPLPHRQQQRPIQISRRAPEPTPQPQQQPAVVEVEEVIDGPVISNHGQFEGLKLISDPPDLQQWREKLFHVEDTITLTEEEYVLYFHSVFRHGVARV